MKQYFFKEMTSSRDSSSFIDDMIIFLPLIDDLPLENFVVHRLLKYLKSTPGQSLFFSINKKFHLSQYVDAYWGSCLDTEKSITAFVFSLMIL